VGYQTGEEQIRRKLMRASLAFVLLLVTFGITTIAASPPPLATGRDPSGLIVLPALDRTGIAQLPEPLAKALSDAQSFARKNPAIVGYPYADRTTGELVLSAATPSGTAAWQGWRPDGIAAAAVRRRVRTVATSYARLETIRFEAIGPGAANLPDSGLIYMTTQDDENNRVLIVVDHRSDALFAALAARYGTEAIAVRVEPDPVFRDTGRQDDVTPFYGGAYIRATLGCTSAFSFLRNGSPIMVTAGHCASQGGDVYTGYNGGTYHMGYIYSFSQQNENWSDSTGTTVINGGYYGDLALVTIDAGKSDSPWMYVGGVNSATAAPVKELWYRDPQNGDYFCTGGSSTGELCNWQVTNALTNIRRGGCGTCPLAVNITIGFRQYGDCLKLGDSGGPTYTVRPDSGIAAKGVMGSATNLGGTNNCQVEFTNVRYVPSAWPGSSLYTQ
jgi:hypothetical protein